MRRRISSATFSCSSGVRLSLSFFWSLSLGSVMSEKFSDQIHQKIGEVVVAFNQLDRLVNETIWFMVSEGEDIGDAITDSVKSLDTRLSILSKLGQCRLPEAKQQDLEECITEIQKCFSAIRNRVSHNFWLIPTAEGTEYAIRLDPKRGDVGTNEQRIRVKNLEADLKRVSDITLRLAKKRADASLINIGDE